MARIHRFALQGMLVIAVGVGGPFLLSGCGDSAPDGSQAKTDPVEKQKNEDAMRKFMESKAAAKGGAKGAKR